MVYPGLNWGIPGGDLYCDYPIAPVKSTSTNHNEALAEKVKTFWRELPEIGPNINYLVSRLITTSNNGIALFGGAVRDLWLDKTIKDIDIVVDSDYFQDIIFGYQNKNNYGGYVLMADGAMFDLWNLKDTVAFQSGKYEISWEGLVKSVPFNTDAILVTTRGKVYENGFWDALSCKTIKFVNTENRNPKLIARRAIKFSVKYEFGLSVEVDEYVKKHLTQGEIKDMYSKATDLYSKTPNTIKSSTLIPEPLSTIFKDTLTTAKYPSSNDY